MATYLKTSATPTLSTCTKTREIGRPVTTIVWSASCALQAKSWLEFYSTVSSNTCWMTWCQRANVVSESIDEQWTWFLPSVSYKRRVSSNTRTSTYSSSTWPRLSTLNRTALWSVLHKLGCPPKFIQIICSLHKGMLGRVIENGEASVPFPVSTGVKQGCVLASTFFNLLFWTLPYPKAPLE